MSGGETFHLHYFYFPLLQIVKSTFLAKSGGGGENQKKILGGSFFLFEWYTMMILRHQDDKQ